MKIPVIVTSVNFRSTSMGIISVPRPSSKSQDAQLCSNFIPEISFCIIWNEMHRNSWKKARWSDVILSQTNSLSSNFGQMIRKIDWRSYRNNISWYLRFKWHFYSDCNYAFSQDFNCDQIMWLWCLLEGKITRSRRVSSQKMYVQKNVLRSALGSASALLSPYGDDRPNRVYYSSWTATSMRTSPGGRRRVNNYITGGKFGKMEENKASRDAKVGELTWILKITIN